MSEFRELLGADHQSTLQFFYGAIRENIPKEVVAHDADVLHCATILASYAQTSTGSASGEGFPLATDLSQFFDLVVMDRSGFRPCPAEQLALGGQLLFLSGFFRDHFARRHNVDWYNNLGAHLYRSAAEGYLRIGTTADYRRADFCYRMSSYYEFWAHTFLRVHRYFRKNQMDPRLIRL